MTTCSDRGVAVRFSGLATGSSTMLFAASGAEMSGLRMREGKKFRCKHHRRMTTKSECRERFSSGEEGCRPGNTPCALGQLAAGETE